MNEPVLNPAPDLQWVEEVAALLPEDLRLGWYQNVRPWLRMLPPEDEVAHLAYSMGYLALLTRSTPALIAAEWAKLTPMLQRLSDEMHGALKTSAAYHQKLNDRLNRLPEEIAEGLSPDAIAAEIAASVREQFVSSGIPTAGDLLTEQGKRLQHMVAEQSRILADLGHQLCYSRVSAKWALDAVLTSAHTAKESIDRWNRQMREVQWVHLGLSLMIGVLLGSLLYWSAFPPVPVAPVQPVHQNQPIHENAPASGKAGCHVPK